MQRRFLALDPALRALLRRLAVTCVDVDARHDHLALLRHCLDDLTGAALVLAGQHHDLVALLDLLPGHHSTSGASEMIFMCLRALSSRTTGPKIRVPIGSSFLLTSTAALESKRITEPSGRRMSLAVRTITARCTSPFFTRPRGAASLTDTTMMSPTPAVRRFEPPSTLMHWTRLAPLLSATSRLDCIWIMVRPLSSQILLRRPLRRRLRPWPSSSASSRASSRPSLRPASTAQPEPRAKAPPARRSRPRRSWRCRCGRRP